MLDCSEIDAKFFDDDDSFDLIVDDVFDDSNLDVSVVSFTEIDEVFFWTDIALFEFC